MNRHLSQRIDIITDRGDVERCVVVLAFADKPPAQEAPVQRVAEGQAGMLLEFLGGTGGTGSGQIGRGGADDERNGSDFARNDAFFQLRLDPQAQINAVLDMIDLAIGGTQLQGQTRVTVSKARNQRGQHMPSECGCRRNAKPPLKFSFSSADGPVR